MPRAALARIDGGGHHRARACAARRGRRRGACRRRERHRRGGAGLALAQRSRRGASRDLGRARWCAQHLAARTDGARRAGAQRGSRDRGDGLPLDNAHTRDAPFHQRRRVGRRRGRPPRHCRLHALGDDRAPPAVRHLQRVRAATTASAGSAARCARCSYHGHNRARAASRGEQARARQRCCCCRDRTRTRRWPRRTPSPPLFTRSRGHALTHGPFVPCAGRPTCWPMASARTRRRGCR